MRQIKVEMIHDLVCSWCPIGYNNFKAAANVLKDEVELDLQFLPFELNPQMPTGGENIMDWMRRRTGSSIAEIEKYRVNLIEVGAKSGVNFDFSKRTHYYNTSTAHILMHWASTQNKHIQLNEALIPAYFTNGIAMDDLEQLMEVVDSVGLDVNEATAALGNPVIQAGFEAKKKRIQSFNVSSVPAFIIDQTHLVSGSNSADFFIDLFRNESIKQADRKLA